MRATVIRRLRIATVYACAAACIGAVALLAGAVAHGLGASDMQTGLAMGIVGMGFPRFVSWIVPDDDS